MAPWRPAAERENLGGLWKLLPKSRQPGKSKSREMKWVSHLWTCNPLIPPTSANANLLHLSHRGGAVWFVNSSPIYFTRYCERTKNHHMSPNDKAKTCTKPQILPSLDKWDLLTSSVLLALWIVYFYILQVSLFYDRKSHERKTKFLKRDAGNVIKNSGRWVWCPSGKKKCERFCWKICN